MFLSQELNLHRTIQTEDIADMHSCAEWGSDLYISHKVGLHNERCKSLES
jgi:hypothetical protein